MRRSIALILVGVTLCVSGCGGPFNSDTGSTSTVTVKDDQPLSRSQFIEQADAICAKFDPKVQALGDEAEEIIQEGNEGDDELAEAADIFRSVNPVVEGGVEELRAITPPTADAKAFASYERSVEAQMTALDDLSDALEDGDVPGIEEVRTELETQNATTDGLAEGLGFEVCGGD